MAQRAVTLCHTDYPLYSVRVVGDRHLMVAGGGGQAKTGISNAIEFFELKNDGGSCMAQRVNHFDTDGKAIMNSTSFPEGKNYTLAAGMDGLCQIYNLKYKVVTPKKAGHSIDGVRKRKGNLTKSEEHNKVEKVIMFDIEPVIKIQTDFSKEGGFQKAVQFTRDRTLMATAGADGYLRVWKYPSLDRLYEVEAHMNEIDDLDISPDGSKIVTVSRDNHAYVWNTKDGKLFLELQWGKQNAAKYRTRACRFATVKDRKQEVTHLFTAHIPSTRSSSPDPCYLTKWDANNFMLKRSSSIGKEIISSFAVSTDGIFLGVGTISGSVSVYIAFSLQRLYHVAAAHTIFVTGLDFAPITSSCRAVTGNYEFTLFSISADNQVKIHQSDVQSLWSPLWAVFGFLLFLYFL